MNFSEQYHWDFLRPCGKQVIAFYKHVVPIFLISVTSCSFRSGFHNHDQLFNMSLAKPDVCHWPGLLELIKAATSQAIYPLVEAMNWMFVTAAFWRCFNQLQYLCDRRFHFRVDFERVLVLYTLRNTHRWMNCCSIGLYLSPNSYCYFLPSKWFDTVYISRQIPGE